MQLTRYCFFYFSFFLLVKLAYTYILQYYSIVPTRNKLLTFASNFFFVLVAGSEPENELIAGKPARFECFFKLFVRVRDIMF